MPDPFKFPGFKHHEQRGLSPDADEGEETNTCNGENQFPKVTPKSNQGEQQTYGEYKSHRDRPDCNYEVLDGEHC